MDTDGIEDMPFGVDASPQDCEDDTSDITDDELLDETVVDELMLWDEADSPPSMPMDIDREVAGFVDLTTAQLQHAPKEQLAYNPVRSGCDRWCID